MITPMIRVYLIDDQAILRAGFRSLIQQQGEFEVVGDHGDARAAIEEIGALRPDVILLDITMPGLSGIDAIPQIRKAAPRAHVLMLTHHEGQSFVDQALDPFMAGRPTYRRASLALCSRTCAARRPRVAAEDWRP